MPAKKKPSDSKLVLIKFSRGLTYLVYGYCIVASVFLALGTFLLLFGANTDNSFTQFIYSGAENFLQPFSGIFPPHQVSDSGYFSTSAVFAIIVYMIIALTIHALITWLTAKMIVHQRELSEEQAEEEAEAAKAERAATKPAPATAPAKPRPAQPRRTI